MREDYVKVRCFLIQVSAAAILIALDGEDEEHWIPLSLVHGADELMIRKLVSIDIVTIRIMAWKAKELGI